MTETAPDIIWAKGALREVCKAVFSFPADYYDLNEYERVLPGAKARIWDMVKNEAAYQGIAFPE